MNPAKTNWTFIEQMLKTGDRVFLHGPPGLGKTYAATRMGLREGQKVYTITCNPDFPATELRGNMFPTKERTLEWIAGIGQKAMEEGARLVLNELSHAGPDMLSLIYPIADTPESAQLTLPTNPPVTIFPREGYQVVATDNVPLVDMDPPIQSRFPLSAYIGELHADAVAVLPAAWQEIAVESIHRGTASGETGAQELRVTYRHWLEFIKQEREYGADVAGEMVFQDAWESIGDSLKVSGMEG